jgi:hypothetical protein
VGGASYGPTGFGQIRGRPGRVGTPRRADDPDLARDLWRASEELTQVRYAGATG